MGEDPVEEEDDALASADPQSSASSIPVCAQGSFRSTGVCSLAELAPSGYTYAQFRTQFIRIPTTCKLHPKQSRAKRATWLNGAKEFYIEF